MKILILGLNYAPENIGIAVYTAGMASELAARGHSVSVIAGQPYYPQWQVADGHSPYAWSRANENGVDVTRCPHYVPKNPSGARRILHHLSFALTALFPTLVRALTERPDVVMTIAPSLIAAPIARLAAKLVGARSWLHVQDFEVEAALATNLLGNKTLAARLAARFERRVLNAFHNVSTISSQMCRKLEQKGVPAHAITEFRNWADISSIRPLESPSPYRAEWDIGTPHVALYSGNIANKQGIEIVIDAAHALRHRQDLTFVICGEGPNRENLLARARGLDNIRFYDLQPRTRLNDLMGLATLHLLPQLASAADLVLPSKLTNMLASGRPIVATADEGTGLAAEVDGHGIVTPPGDSAAFAAAIEQLIDDADLHADLGKAARTRAEHHWAGEAILSRIELRLLALVELDEGRKAPTRPLNLV